MAGLWWECKYHIEPQTFVVAEVLANETRLVSHDPKTKSCSRAHQSFRSTLSIRSRSGQCRSIHEVASEWGCNTSPSFLGVMAGPCSGPITRNG
jgi:hypothetical protein